MINSCGMCSQDFGFQWDLQAVLDQRRRCPFIEDPRQSTRPTPPEKGSGSAGMTCPGQPRERSFAGHVRIASIMMSARAWPTWSLGGWEWWRRWSVVPSKVLQGRAANGGVWESVSTGGV